MNDRVRAAFLYLQCVVERCVVKCLCKMFEDPLETCVAKTKVIFRMSELSESLLAQKYG